MNFPEICISGGFKEHEKSLFHLWAQYAKFVKYFGVPLDEHLFWTQQLPRLN